MPNFISEDEIEAAMLQHLQLLYGYDALICFTADPADLNDGSGRTDKREVILSRLWPFFRLAIGMIINALSWTEKISRESSPGFASVPLLPNPILIFRAFMFQSVSQNGC